MKLNSSSTVALIIYKCIEFIFLSSNFLKIVFLIDRVIFWYLNIEPFLFVSWLLWVTAYIPYFISTPLSKDSSLIVVKNQVMFIILWLVSFITVLSIV